MVDNCDVTAEVTTPKPLLNTDEPICPNGETACADGTCLPTALFCDGHADCYDHSDEGWCDPEHDPNAAPICNYANVIVIFWNVPVWRTRLISMLSSFQCSLPDCFCSSDGTLVPGGLLPSDVPQMITITFDDAVNDENWNLYQNKLFKNSRKNPNGCPIHATFYVSHEYTNYAMVSN